VLLVGFLSGPRGRGDDQQLREGEVLLALFTCPPGKGPFSLEPLWLPSLSRKGDAAEYGNHASLFLPLLLELKSSDSSEDNVE